MPLEVHRHETGAVAGRLVADLTGGAAGGLCFDDVAVVIELEPDAGRRLRPDARELRVSRQGRERVAGRTFAIVDRGDAVFAAAMFRVTGQARGLFRGLRLAAVATAEQDVRGVRQPVSAGWIVAALAANGGDLAAGLVTLHTLQIDARMGRRDVSGRERPLRAGQVSPQHDHSREEPDGRRHPQHDPPSRREDIALRAGLARCALVLRARHQ